MSLFENQIPLLKPWLGDEEWNATRDVIHSGWVSQGHKVQEFENKVAAFVGAKYAVAVNACTSAIHLAMKIAGVTYGDEVILADTTCMANVNAIVMAGAKPIFVDIDRRTFNIDPDLIEGKISDKTKLILNIDQIGQTNDLDKIKAIADKHHLSVVDDAATALGGKYKGKYLGSCGIPATYSFHPRKIITTGEGGMLVTDDEKLAEQARVLRSTGASVSDLDRHKAKGIVLQKYYESGYNYRMTDIQAAIGIVQMGKIQEILKQRKEQADFYNHHFKEMEELQIPFIPDYAEPAWSSYCLTITKSAKVTVTDILNFMASKNISCRYGIQPLHQEPYFNGTEFKDQDFPVSCEIAEKTFFIPIFPGLEENELVYIVNNLKQAFKDKL
jgi:perosamine synthetase